MAKNELWFESASLESILLVKSHCDLLDCTVKKSGSYEIKFDTNVAFQADKESIDKNNGFLLRVSVELVGFESEDEDKSLFKLSAEVVAKYFIIGDLSVNAREATGDIKVFVDQVFPFMRQHMTDTLTKMGVSAGMNAPWTVFPEEVVLGETL